MGQALGAKAAGATSVVAPMRYLSSQLPLDKELGIGPGFDLAPASFLGLVLLLLAVTLVHYAARDLYRWRTRRAALMDNLAAVPPARGISMPTDVPDVSQRPLKIIWHATSGQRLLAAPLSVLIVLLQLGLLAAWVIVLVAGLASSSDHLPLGFRVALLAGVVLVVVAALVLFVPLLCRMPTYFGRPFGVLALPNLIPIVVLLGSSVVESLASLLPMSAPEVNSSGGAFFVDYLLAMFGACGLIALRLVWRGFLGSIVYAHKQAISAGSTRFAAAIPWVAIDCIIARREGHPVTYVICGAWHTHTA